MTFWTNLTVQSIIGEVKHGLRERNDKDTAEAIEHIDDASEMLDAIEDRKGDTSAEDSEIDYNIGLACSSISGYLIERHQDDGDDWEDPEGDREDPEVANWVDLLMCSRKLILFDEAKPRDPVWDIRDQVWEVRRGVRPYCDKDKNMKDVWTNLTDAIHSIDYAHDVPFAMGDIEDAINELQGSNNTESKNWIKSLAEALEAFESL